MQKRYTGFHAVEERLRHYGAEKKHSAQLHILYSKAGPRVKKILALAKEYGVPCESVDTSALDEQVRSLPPEARDHRGIVLLVDGEDEKLDMRVQLDQWLASCPETATVVILDGVTDPHNVGAILRSCDQLGAALLVMGERRSAAGVQDGEVMARASAGASAYVPVAVVTNLARVAQQLKDAGFWIYGADMGGSPLPQVKFAEKTCIVMGSEGAGISRLLQDNCDQIVSIPTCGRIDSLNVSVAAGIILYERRRQSL
ncbi:MAG: 23S rRNA (guanosine(2251)-2'-O)-methyltransferase RlmB [Treponema sp.]|nr:23S rRNA (guanosine(2251)-2'-O)-methyltransferase RlmB [Treponema sp.]